MNLHEYQAKKLFACYGIPTPTGYTCITPREAEEASAKIGNGPWFVKCQIHAGGRSKASGIKFVNSKKDVRDFAETWLGKRLITQQTSSIGQPVYKVLVEEATDIDKEFYLSVIIDYSTRRVIFMASNRGGIEIEKESQDYPETIYKTIIDPFNGAQPYQGRKLAFKLGLTGKQSRDFTIIFMGLSTLFLERDMRLAEINPLAITKNGDLLCLDGKLSVDKNALFRQPKLHAMRDLSQQDELESSATLCGMSYVSLDGNIGCVVNGAGLAMGTMDMVKLHGGNPANFLDVGGDVTKDRVTEAFKIILSEKKVKAILVNIFGGIVRCDLIADGIISAIADMIVKIPVVVRLEGNNAKIGAKKLANNDLNIIHANNLTDAIMRVISAVDGKSCRY